MSTGSGLTTGDLSARRHLKENNKNLGIFFPPPWFFRFILFFFGFLCRPFFFSIPDDIFWFLASIFFFYFLNFIFLFIYLSRVSWTLCRYMIGLCVSRLSCLQRRFHSVFFFFFVFFSGMFFLIFLSRPIWDSTFDFFGREKISPHFICIFCKPKQILFKCSCFFWADTNLCTVNRPFPNLYFKFKGRRTYVTPNPSCEDDM